MVRPSTPLLVLPKTLTLARHELGILDRRILGGQDASVGQAILGGSRCVRGAVCPLYGIVVNRIDSPDYPYTHTRRPCPSPAFPAANQEIR